MGCEVAFSANGQVRFRGTSAYTPGFGVGHSRPWNRENEGRSPEARSLEQPHESALRALAGSRDLEIVERGVEPALHEELFVRAALDDVSA